MTAAPLIIVHQMAKVASLAWVKAARPAVGAGDPDPLHVHYLTAGNLAAFDAILHAPAAANTIVNALIVRQIERKGRAAAATLARAREEGRPIRVITGMRDPVARSASLVSFLADFVGRRSGGLSARDGASPESVCRFLRDTWRAVLTGTEPAGSFERLAWRMSGAYRTWFEEELAVVFSVDVFSTPFPGGGGAQRLEAPGVEALAYRTEDMGPTAAASALRAAAATFLGAPDFALPQINTADTRRSWPLYRAVSEGFRLPADWLDEVYTAPAVTHFYGAEEIAGFKARWGSAG